MRGLSQATLVAQTILTSTLYSDDLNADGTRGTKSHARNGRS